MCEACLVCVLGGQIRVIMHIWRSLPIQSVTWVIFGIIPLQLGFITAGTIPTHKLKRAPGVFQIIHVTDLIAIGLPVVRDLHHPFLFLRVEFQILV